MSGASPSSRCIVSILVLLGLEWHVLLSFLLGFRADLARLEAALVAIVLQICEADRDSRELIIVAVTFSASTSPFGVGGGRHLTLSFEDVGDVG